jgi:hypothetical protein
VGDDSVPKRTKSSSSSEEVSQSYPGSSNKNEFEKKTKKHKVERGGGFEAAEAPGKEKRRKSLRVGPLGC